MATIDYLNDENGDLTIENGDFAKGDSTLQHAKDLILAEIGDYKQNPGVGFGLVNHINENTESDDIIRGITEELEKDGFKISKIKIEPNGDLNLDGSY